MNYCRLTRVNAESASDVAAMIYLVMPHTDSVHPFFNHRIVKGFEDKKGIREFLFALPRFAVDKVSIYTFVVAVKANNES